MVVVLTGLAGSTALEEAQTLMIGGCATDTLAPILKMYGVKDEEAKASIYVVVYLSSTSLCYFSAPLLCIGSLINVFCFIYACILSCKMYG